jgi:hypothetical protein
MAGAAQRLRKPCVGADKLVDHLIRAGHVRHGAYGWLDGDAKVARYDIEPGVVFIRPDGLRALAVYRPLM